MGARPCGAATGFLMSGGNLLGAVLGGVSAGSANLITGAGTSRIPPGPSRAAS